MEEESTERERQLDSGDILRMSQKARAIETSGNL